MIIHLEYMFVNHKYTINVYLYMFTISLLITPQQKRKSPVKSLATIGGALHSLLGFLFAVSSMQEEIKDLCSISPLDNLHNLPH